MARKKPRVQTTDWDESRTVQADALKADIRHILSRYEQTGVVLGMRNVDLQFRDVSEFDDFSDLMRQTKEAEATFMRLPSKLREVFSHDVNEWLDAAHDPEKLNAKRPQLEKLGLWEPVAQSPAPGGPSNGDQPSPPTPTPGNPS